MHAYIHMCFICHMNIMNIHMNIHVPHLSYEYFCLTWLIHMNTHLWHDPFIWIHIYIHMINIHMMNETHEYSCEYSYVCNIHMCTFTCVSHIGKSIWIHMYVSCFKGFCVCVLQCVLQYVLQCLLQRVVIAQEIQSRDHNSVKWPT